MTMKLTAEQVAAELKQEAANHRQFFEIDHDRGDDGMRMAYEHAAKIVRDNLLETPDERRARFEEFMEPHRRGEPRLFERNPIGEYVLPIVQAAWIGFCAAIDFRGDT